jgi:hypothetical protein
MSLDYSTMIIEIDPNQSNHAGSDVMSGIKIFFSKNNQKLNKMHKMCQRNIGSMVQLLIVHFV